MFDKPARQLKQVPWIEPLNPESFRLFTSQMLYRAQSRAEAITTHFNMEPSPIAISQ